MALFWMDSARAYIPFLFNSPYIMVYSLPIGYIAQTTSVYLTVFAALDCYVGMRWRRRLSSWVKPRTAVTVVAAVAAASAAYNAIRFMYYDLRSCTHGGKGAVMVEICPSELFMDSFPVYPVYLYMIFIVAVPFSLLLALMVLILHTLSRPRKSAAAAADGEQKYTLILVISLFLACNTLALFINFFEAFFDPEPLLLNFLTDASNFLVIFNSSVNFVIYMIFSPAYRRTVVRWCGRLCRRSGKRSFGPLLVASVSPPGSGLLYTTLSTSPPLPPPETLLLSFIDEA